ncbi:MAG: hypothetical protein GKR94_13995 [Gammaproteobacteria bacterium]|nr:hypothetical protein [Gammaproteobacteria bacterium]
MWHILGRICLYKLGVIKVCNDHDLVIITRKRESSVVMMSLDDFHAMEEEASKHIAVISHRRQVGGTLGKSCSRANAPSPNRLRAVHALSAKRLDAHCRYRFAQWAGCRGAMAEVDCVDGRRSSASPTSR